MMKKYEPIEGTPIFDGHAAMQGYALNAMCYSFNEQINRDEFLSDEDAYCTKYNLNEQQRAAVKSRQVLDLVAAGGNVYYLAKYAGTFGLNMQDIGAQQRGVTLEEFNEMLRRSGD